MIGGGKFALDVNRLKLETDNLPPSSAEL